MELMERIRKWFTSLYPKNFLDMMVKEKGNASLKEAMANVLLSMVPVIVLMAVLLAYVVFSSTQSSLAIVGAVTVLVVMIFLVPLAFLLRQGIYWISGKLLGGTGSFAQQCYFLSFPEAAFGIFDSTIGLFLMLIPCVGNLVSFIVSLYGLYLQYLSFKSIHNLDTIKAAVAALAPSALLLILIVILILIVGPAGVFNKLQNPILK